MKYTQQTFTCPTCISRKMDQTAYEVAVGLRCPVCLRLLPPGGQAAHNASEECVTHA